MNCANLELIGRFQTPEFNQSLSMKRDNHPITKALSER